MKLDTDVLNHLDPTGVATLTLGIIDHIQDEQAERQIVALAASFMMLSRHLGVEPSALWAVTNNIVHAADGYRPEFRGVQAYMEGEYPK